MLLIRPWLRMNKYRVTAHHVVFFIFIVSNVGGCLTPIGDPPLFLGYLKGIPFWWVAEHCWPMWMVGTGILLAMFFVVDTLNFRKAPKRVRAEQTHHEDWRFDGLPNVLFLAMILVAVFIKNPPFLREALMLGAAVASYFTTKKAVHRANDFNFHPIQEVAILFVGIFATMMPALDWLQANSKMLGTPSPSLYYWACGTLSAFLDNAPTYLSFLSATGGTIDTNIILQIEAFNKSGAEIATLTGPNAEEIRQTVGALQQYSPAKLAAGAVAVEDIRIAYLLGNITLNKFIVAISVAAVFFGAATYIGNGPNFMVKAIAEHQNVHTPGFMGYLAKYTLLFLLPMIVVVWWIFFRQ
jgi:Na+/H+ antiporter NhaD/arsenite permease-like protein